MYGLLGLSETEFAWLFAPGIVGVMAGAWLSGRLAGRLTQQKTVWLAYSIMFGAASFWMFFLRLERQKPRVTA